MALTAFWDYDRKKWFNYETLAYDSLVPVFRDFLALIAKENKDNGSSVTAKALTITKHRVAGLVNDPNNNGEVAKAIDEAMTLARKREFPHYAHEWDIRLRGCLRLLVCRGNKDINYVFLYQHANVWHQEILNSTITGKVKCVTTARACSYVAIDDDTATLLTIAGVPLIEITDELRSMLHEEEKNSEAAARYVRNYTQS